MISLVFANLKVAEYKTYECYRVSSGIILHTWDIVMFYSIYHLPPGICHLS